MNTPTFRLFATGRVLVVDGGHLTLISAGLNSVTIIVGFAIFAAIRRTLAFDKRLVFTQFAVGGSFGHTLLWGHLALGLAWPAAFAAAGLVIFWIRTRTRVHAR